MVLQNRNLDICRK